jgi:hypothetical protein
MEYPNPTCWLCEMADETPLHIIRDCEALGHLRHYHFLEFLQNTPPEWKVQHLIQFLNHTHIINLESDPHSLNYLLICTNIKPQAAKLSPAKPPLIKTINGQMAICHSSENGCFV